MDLTRVIEKAEARNAVSCAVSRARLLNIRPARLHIAGGVGVFAGPDSPLTHAVGVGFENTPVRSTLDALEVFFRAKRAPSRMRLAASIPLDFRMEVERRGYTVEDSLQVLMRRLVVPVSSEKHFRAARINKIDKRDRRAVLTWNRAVSEGFLGRRPTDDVDLQVAMVISGIQRAQCFAEIKDDELAGGAALVVYGRVAIFFGDATRLKFQGNGVQRSLIHARLNAARQAACEWCVAATPPGSVSERNYRAAGFLPVYCVTRFVLP